MCANPRRLDVPKWDLVGAPERPNSEGVQTSPFSPTPPELRSGRSLLAPRSDSGPTTLRLFIGDGAEALRLLRWLRREVALLDEDLPSFGGTAIARILKTELPETRVVVLTRATAGARR